MAEHEQLEPGMGQFSGRSVAEGLESTLLSASAANEQLDRYQPVEPSSEISAIRAELIDDPDLTIHQLSPDEQARLELRVVACEHTDEYAADIAAAIGKVDYYIGESTVLSSSSRLPNDLMANTYARKIAMNFEYHPGTVIRMQGELDAIDSNVVEHNRQLGGTPILRTMDVSLQDVIPIAEIPHLRHIFDGRLDMEALLSRNRSLAKELRNSRFTTAVSVNRERLAISIELGALETRIRELQQIDDISVIAANAVKRHPEMEHITIGIMQGQHHRAVLSSLIEGTSVKGEVIDVPPLAEEAAEDQAVMRAAATGVLPDEDMLDKALLDKYVEYLAMDSLGPEAARKLLPRVYARLHSELSADEVKAVLSDIDACIVASDSTDTLRSQYINRRLHGIPAVADIVADESSDSAP